MSVTVRVTRRRAVLFRTTLGPYQSCLFGESLQGILTLFGVKTSEDADPVIFTYMDFVTLKTHCGFRVRALRPLVAQEC